MKRSEALRLREIIEEAVQSLDDETAQEAIILFPEAKEDKPLVKDKRYRHEGKLKKAKKDKKKDEKKDLHDPEELEEIAPPKPAGPKDEKEHKPDPKVKEGV